MAAADLPAVALPAWHAFQAMQASKVRHIEYLSELEDRYGSDAAASEAERTRLEELLAEHDQRVMDFKSAVQALAEHDPAAQALLLQKMAAV